ncbi:unnamed protein product [Zymoseptoria tritici ST99CH_3D7]|uniref:Uncharacterized protein n=1 Tax=Zymoseptoria tritici (strain ST99CH_3D7) TaxID=1276538 RepID=A0A1X7S0Z9_ZYMT9|nr:unnamed protein product [Zymoseptoria tritici ST99CH_3D7]
MNGYANNSNIIQNEVAPGGEVSGVDEHKEMTGRSPAKGSASRPPALSKFFATPELCERMLLFLRHPKSILQAAQVFKDVENTIQGSSKLQIALFYKPDLRTVTGTAVKRKLRRDSYYFHQNYRNNIPVYTPPPPERFLAINSLAFTTPCSCDDNQLLYLCLHMKKLYNAVRPNLGSLAKVFLTQPPVESVNVECYIDGWDQRISWQLDVAGGIQVQDLVDFIREKSKDPSQFREAFQRFNPEYKVCLRLRDGDEIVEE